MRKQHSVAIATLLLFAVCGFTIRRPHAQNQEPGTKIGIRNHIYKAPLEVVGLKVNNKSIDAGTEFFAGRGWIKHLSIIVTNTSDRDLIGVGASAEFPYDG